MNQYAAPLAVTHSRTHRTFRAGACPVLDVTVTYPCLGPGQPGSEESPAVARFNEAYRSMAENLLEWAQGPVLEAAMADFEAAGAGAVYHFDRRIVICDMTASPVLSGDTVEVDFLTVSRSIRVGSRRGEAEERGLTATDRWRWPELTLCPSNQRRGRPFLS